MTEIIEGEAVEVALVPHQESAVVVRQQPGQVLASDTPTEMVERASHLATVLKDIVERQKLYAVISGKKYPQVEAWMTIARLDNVVAREPQPPIRHDDGSYEAFAELIRLSDGMVIGASSALCGTADDKPWGGRAEPARRSMAQTRATSRAFRQQYSWIMALAGYEPTPAEEMPRDDGHSPARVAPAVSSSAAGAGELWSGPVSKGQAPVDGQLRQTPDGPAFGFVVTDQNGKRVQVLALGPLADALNLACGDGLPAEATVDGDLEMVPWEKKQPDGTMKSMPPFRRVIARKVITPDFTVPADSVAPGAPQAPRDDELDNLAW